MNVKTTKLLTFHCIYHPQIVCICPDPTEADDQLELSYKTGFQKYLDITEDWMVICVDENEMNKEHYSINKGANKFKMDFHVVKMCQ